ncbi:MAG: hypothetical protein NDJ94_13020 [Vicinamibacteria bacterium]|nr:hypothetical protein [Vicinamibacteria bacterium]
MTKGRSSSGRFIFNEDDREELLSALDGRTDVIEKLEEFIDSNRPYRITASTKDLASARRGAAAEIGQRATDSNSWWRQRTDAVANQLREIAKVRNAAARLRRQLAALSQGARQTLSDPWQSGDVIFLPDLSAMRALPEAWLSEAETAIDVLHSALALIDKADRERRKPGPPRRPAGMWRLILGVRIAQLLLASGLAIKKQREGRLSRTFRTCLAAMGFPYPADDDLDFQEAVIASIRRAG